MWNQTICMHLQKDLDGQHESLARVSGCLRHPRALRLHRRQVDFWFRLHFVVFCINMDVCYTIFLYNRVVLFVGTRIAIVYKYKLHKIFSFLICLILPYSTIKHYVTLHVHLTLVPKILRFILVHSPKDLLHQCFFFCMFYIFQKE